MNNDIFRHYDEIKDDLKFYGISSVRMKIMISLMEGPKKTKHLRRLTGIPSSTIIHGINELEKQKIVLKEGDIYYLSETGQIIAPKLMEIIKTLNVTRKFENLLLCHEINDIPSDSAMTIGSLCDSELIESDNTDISKSFNAYLDILCKSKKIRGVSTIFHPEFINAFWELLEDEEVEIELILSDEVLKKTITSINPLNLKQFIKLNARGNLHLWVLNEQVNMAFTVTEKFLSLGFYSKDGVYDSSRDLISESTEAINWAVNLFEYYRKRSDKIELRRLHKLISHLI